MSKYDPCDVICPVKLSGTSWNARFMKERAGMAWSKALGSTASWPADAGIGFELTPDGSSRFASLAFMDVVSGEVFKYAISLIDPSGHEVFVPFDLFACDKKPFVPADHAKVELCWIVEDPLETDMVFSSSGFFVGKLKPGEFNWPGGTPPFMGTPVYLETFDGKPRYKTTGSVGVKTAEGPEATGIPGAIECLFSDGACAVSWRFSSIARWKVFGGLSLWYYGGEKQQTILVDIKAGGKTFTHPLLSAGDEWQSEHAEWDDYVDQQGTPFDPKTCKSAVIAFRPAGDGGFPAEIGIGPFRVDDD